MSENEMNNRGSKSHIDHLGLYNINESLNVKEQRVDGSWQVGDASCLRYTLIGFERGCRSFYNFDLFSNTIESSKTKILTKVSLSKNFSTLSKCKLDPWFLTGFSDAEGSFIVSIYKDHSSKLK